MDLDQYQESLGGITSYQLWVIFMSTWIVFGSGPMQSFGIYLSAVPIHRCSVPPIDSAAFNLTEAEIKNLTIPFDNNKDTYSSCSRYAYNLTACANVDDLPGCLMSQGSQSEIGTMKCDAGYHFNNDVFLETTVSEFSLVCDDAYLDSLANTLYFLGYFIGSLLTGPLADWFGRVVAMQVSCVGLAVSGTITAFMATYTTYVIMRIITAAFVVACYITFYTYAQEINTTKLRTATTVWSTVSVAVSHVILPWYCYALQDWRHIHILLSVMALPFFFFSFFIPETPRWLAAKGKFKELRKVLTRYAASKNMTLSDDTWGQIQDCAKLQRKAAEAAKENEEKVVVWDLFRRPLMRMLSFNTMFMWFTVAMVYYGLVLNGGNLSGDFYVNNTLNSAVEILGDLSVLLAVHFGRKKIFSLSLFSAGIFCISSMLTNINANGDQSLLTASTVLVIIGKAFGSAGFALAYIVTSEIFPTTARATAISMGSAAARVGSMFSPFILQINQTLPWFTQTIFGGLSIIAGFLTVLFPETNGVQFITSLDEAETFYKQNVGVLKLFKNSQYQKQTNDDQRKEEAYDAENPNMTPL